jgi:hypothetical protein
MTADLCPDPTRTLIFGDDSSKSAKKFFAYGSIYFAEARRNSIERKLLAALGTYDREIKWNEARDLFVVKRFVNELFNHWTSISYRCIVVPIRQINQAAPSSKRALLRAKLVFTHLDTFRKTFQGKPRFDVTLDEDDFDPAVQQLTLNRNFWNKYGGDHDMYERIRGMASKENLFLQAADIITGAVAWVSNDGLDAPVKGGNYDHRHAVATLVAQRARLAAIKDRAGNIIVPQKDVRTLGHPTTRWLERGFSIWHVDLARSKKMGLLR